MKNNKQLFLNLYMLNAIMHIFSIVKNMEVVEIVTKIFIIILLLAHIFQNNNKKLKTISPLLIALFFCWLGDIVLIKNESMYFILGLCAFLIAQIFYCITFLKFIDKKQISKVQAMPYLLLPFILYVAILFMLIRPNLGNLLIPVAFYALVITSMAITAFRRWGRSNYYSFIFTFIGAILFVISDSIIALNKFYSPIENASILIMATYIAAQYLIVSGCLFFINPPAENK